MSFNVKGDREVTFQNTGSRTFCLIVEKTTFYLTIFLSDCYINISDVEFLYTSIILRRPPNNAGIPTAVGHIPNKHTSVSWAHHLGLIRNEVGEIEKDVYYRKGGGI